MTREYGRPWNKDRVVGSRKPLSQVEVGQIRTALAADDPHDLCLFLTAIDTMLRASDLLQLRVADVQQNNGVIKTSFPWRQKKTTTGVFPVLTPMTQKALSSWIQFTGKQPEDFLFTRQKPNNNNPITIGFYRTLIKNWVASIGLSPEFYSAHSLRRTKATFLYERGVTVEIIGRLLGHKSPASTIRYLGIDEAHAQDAALTHDIFGSKKRTKKKDQFSFSDTEIKKISDQIWRNLSARLPQHLTENEE